MKRSSERIKKEYEIVETKIVYFKRESTLNQYIELNDLEVI